MSVHDDEECCHYIHDAYTEFVSVIVPSFSARASSQRERVRLAAPLLINLCKYIFSWS